MRPLVAVAILVGFAAAAPVPKAVKKADDKTLLTGTWKSVGKGSDWFRFDDDGKMRAWTTGGSAESGAAYTWAIEPTADPKQMTWGDTTTRPAWECVYELDGDVLRVAYGTVGKRPAKVEAGNGGIFCDLIRVPDPTK